MFQYPAFRTKLFRHACTLLVIIATLNVLGVTFYLHWTLWWFDMVLHFLSGALVAIVWTLLLQILFPLTNNKYMSIGKILLVVFCVGFLWEIFELYVGLTFFSDGMAYLTDTGSDLLLDVIGGYIGILYSRYITK